MAATAARVARRKQVIKWRMRLALSSAIAPCNVQTAIKARANVQVRGAVRSMVLYTIAAVKLPSTGSPVSIYISPGHHKRAVA